MPRTLVSGVDNVLEVAVEADRGREPCTTAREVNKRSKELGYLPQRGNIGRSHSRQEPALKHRVFAGTVGLSCDSAALYHQQQWGVRLSGGHARG